MLNITQNENEFIWVWDEVDNQYKQLMSYNISYNTPFTYTQEECEYLYKYYSGDIDINLFWNPFDTNHSRDLIKLETNSTYDDWTFSKSDDYDEKAELLATIDESAENKDLLLQVAYFNVLKNRKYYEVEMKSAGTRFLPGKYYFKEVVSTDKGEQTVYYPVASYIPNKSYYWKDGSAGKCIETTVTSGFTCAGSIFENNLKVIYQ